MARKSHILLTEQAKNLDKDLLDGLRQVGFKLDFGEDGTGWQFKYLTRGGGYYFNVGCSDLIVKGEIGLVQFSDIAAFVAEGARMRTGETLAADLIVLATGYKGQEHLVRKLFGNDVAMPGPTGESNVLAMRGRGVFVAISPWNFPLAIFLGQVTAALMAGNSVVAKPAEQTPRIAVEAVRLLHEAGIAVLADIHFGRRVPGDGQHIRFSYAASNEAIETGVGRLADFVRKGRA
jgi:hypothetical protein